MSRAIASILAEMHSPVGETPLRIVELDGFAIAAAEESRPRADIRIGVDRAGRLPAGLETQFDLLLTTAPAPGRAWVALDEVALGQALAAIAHRVAASPVAAVTLCQVLRIGAHLSFADALTLESLAYSTLLGGGEFRRWRRRTPPRRRPDSTTAMLEVARRGDVLELRLNRPRAHNAINTALREELVQALRIAAADCGIVRVNLSGAGPSFCSGGDLDEFGSADDMAMAHVIRTLHSVTMEVHALGGRVRAEVHGACIGAGAEIAAAAGEVVARDDALFRLPEVGMGLIPGAGGTASLPARIGRWRTVWLALNGATLDARQALAWGLVDRIAAAGGR